LLRAASRLDGSSASAHARYIPLDSTRDGISNFVWPVRINHGY
jgi:hypothetical protein